MRAGEHVHGEVVRECPLHEGDELFREVPEHDARVGCRIDGGQLEDECRNLDPLRLHRGREEGLFAGKVTQYRGRGDLQLRGNAGESGSFETSACEDAPRGFQKLLPLNCRRPAHL